MSRRMVRAICMALIGGSNPFAGSNDQGWLVRNLFALGGEAMR